jgi:HlyD family secretion protein
MNKRKLLPLAGAALVACVAGAILHARPKHQGGAKMETVKVDRGRVVARVTATGTLSAMVTVQVGSQVSGRLQEIHVDFGSPVKKGQVIARIDPALFQAAEQQARANRAAAAGNLARARAQATEAGRHLDRSGALSARNLIAPADLDTARSNAEVAQASVAAAQGGLEQARAALNQARVMLAYTTIVSPIGGIVISRNVDVGQTVAASLQSPTLFTIAEDLRKMLVHTSVAEADVGKLRAEMMVTFTVDAYPGERFKGAVRQIRDAPQTAQNVVTYDAVIDVDNTELKLKPGMTANVTFVYAEREDVLRVPSVALRFHPPADLAAPGAKVKGRREGKSPSLRRSVWALRDGTPTEVPVEMGVSDGTLAELLTGDLKEGDALITDMVMKKAKASQSRTATAKPKRIF